MATTAPEDVRGGLVALTDDSAVAIAAATAGMPDPEAARAALFEAATTIAEVYKSAAAELATAWYEELRDAADAATAFTPVPYGDVDETKLRASIAVSSRPIFDVSQLDVDRTTAEFHRLFDASIAESIAQTQAQIQREIVSGFGTTIAENVQRDDSATGWRRFTRNSDTYNDGCGFCRMLAARGAVYKKSTARFAAHIECHCVAAPVFDGEPGAEASAMQYVASKRKRTPEQRTALRAYLNEHFPDHPDRKKSDGARSIASAAASATAGFDSLTPDQVRLQIAITEKLKDSPWRTKQLQRLHARKRELAA